MKGKGQKMNIVICDDERKVIEDVGLICRECLSPDDKLYGFRSAESLLKNLDKIEGDIDLFILDIEMPGRDGLWLRKELERYRYGSSIIYLTSHDELVQEAFGRYVIGFVDKVSFLHDKNCLIEKLKLFEQEANNQEILCIKSDQGNLHIRKDKIIAIEAEHVYTYLEYITIENASGIIKTDKMLIRKSLKDWKSELNTDYLKISKSVIVNMNYIKKIEKVVELNNGEVFNIPRSNRLECQEKYFEFCKRKMKWG